MAVMQTPHGRVIGLVPVKDQPKPEPIADKEPVADEKIELVAKKPSRPPKK